MFLSRQSVLLGFVLLSGPVAGEDTPFIDRVQMGDNDLDCGQIAAQVKELDAVLAPHRGDRGAIRGATETVTRSRAGDVMAGMAKVLPFGAIFGDLAKDILGRRGKEADARIASVRARKEYLVDMFLKRKCRLADLDSGGGKADKAGDSDVAKSVPVTPQTGASPPVVESPAARAASAKRASQSSPAPAGKALEAVSSSAAKPEKRAAAASDSAPVPTRGPLFVLDFRLAFRTSADPDGKDGAVGLALGGVPLTAMQALTDNAYVALLKDLAAAGFEVLNPELTAGAPRRGSLPAPARSGDYLYFAPSGAPLAQAPAVTVPGSDAALAETRTALAQAVSGRKPGVHYAIGVWYVDFARIKGDAEESGQRGLETRLAVAAGSHLALVEPAEADSTPAQAVRVLNLGRDLVSREPYGQVRLPANNGGALELRADPERFRVLVERQLKRARSALIGSLPPPAVSEAVAGQDKASSQAPQPTVTPPTAP